MDINWFSFVVVFAATLLAALVVVGSYGSAVRLLAVAADEGRTRPRLYRFAAYACFTICGAAVLYGVYLIVPALHR